MRTATVTTHRLKVLLEEFRRMEAEPIFLFSCGDTNGTELHAIVSELLSTRSDKDEEYVVPQFSVPPKPFS